MKIMYVAKHDTGGNDDEGAIAHALEQLGHEVVKVQEEPGMSRSVIVRADLCLFHKLSDWQFLKWLRCPRVFWYFDQVYNRAPELASRSSYRVDKVTMATAYSDMGFLTDGDWVAKDKTGKLRWLMQGADERVVGLAAGRSLPREEYPSHLRGPDILFCGLDLNCGHERSSFVQFMRTNWGSQFHHIRSGLHREQLRDVVARTRVVVCPDFPVTDRYWSNRVYLMAGFGACVVHPICDGLKDHFNYAPIGDGLEIMPYHDRRGLHHVLASLLASPYFPQEVGARALARVQREHLYRHRCATLIDEVKRTLHV